MMKKKRFSVEQMIGVLMGGMIAQVVAYTRRVFASVGIKDASFHSLRHHGPASWLVMDGVDLYAVGRIIGHKTPRMTQRTRTFRPNTWRLP
jgi:integrase